MASPSFSRVAGNSVQARIEVLRTRVQRRTLAPVALLFLAGANCALQILWLWRLSFRNINYDAVSYVGIARHIADGDFRLSLRGYWSPLISWLVAGVSMFSKDFTLAGRLLTVASFLVCLPAVYLLALRLWNSSTLAALAVFWFTTARGIAAFSAYFIGADFLLTFCVLIYFVLLLECLRHSSLCNWFLLGIPHAFAFLSKAIAMPWLAVATVAACSFSNTSPVKRKFFCASVAMILPLLVWSSWGLALRSKYGHFTAGYQLKWNLLSSDTREQLQRQSSNLVFLTDSSRTYDQYNVVDSMYPGFPLWKQKLSLTNASSLGLRKAVRNLADELKEFSILLTPGGVLGILLAASVRRRKRGTPEAQLLYVACLSSATLLLAYSPLVFDGARYILPIVPVLIALSMPFIWPGTLPPSGRPAPSTTLRQAAFALLIVGTVFSQIYWASPFRSIRRDYQLSCYDAAAKLRALPSCTRLAVLGSGPFPEHGVGWEAGIYSAYFAGCRMVAFSPALPTPRQVEVANNDLKKAGADAILVFGNPRDPAFTSFDPSPQQRFSSEQILDPVLGQVGTLFWKAH